MIGQQARQLVEPVQESDGDSVRLGDPFWPVRRVRAAMATVGLAQLFVVGWIVQTSGFQQDDYLFFYLGRVNGLTVSGLTESVFGSLIPGFNFVNSVLAQTLPIARWQVVVIIMIMYGALVLVFYRLLELLFGPRPGIVLLTAIATCSGLLGVSLVWWTPAINGLPALIADILALDGLLRHAVTGRRRYLVISAVSFAVGTLFYDPSMEVLVPLVLFTLLYLCDVRNPRSVWNAFRSRTWLWLGYSLPILLNFMWRGLHPGEYVIPPAGSVSRTLGFMVGGLVKGMTPSALGVNYLTLGPGFSGWRIIIVGQILLVGIVVATTIRNRSAWRAWVLFFVSFITADLVAAIGRASQAFYFQLNSLYWCFSLFLFVVAFGLAVFPVAHLGDAELGEAPQPSAMASKYRAFGVKPAIATATTIVLCVLGIHYIWATPDRSLGAANRVYTQRLRTEWAKVSSHHRKVFVWDTTVPAFVLNPHFSPYNYLSSTMGLVIGGLRIDSGEGKGYIVNAHGVLVPANSQVLATSIGQSGTPGVTPGTSCVGRMDQATKTQLRFDRALPRGHTFIRIRYAGSSGLEAFLGSEAAVYIPPGNGAVLARFHAFRFNPKIVLSIPRGKTMCFSADIERPVTAGSG